MEKVNGGQPGSGDGAPRVEEPAQSGAGVEGPVIDCQITATLYKDGNYQVHGPLNNRIQYWALIGLSIEAGIMHSLQTQAQRQREAAAALAAQPRKSPGLVRRFIDAASGKSRREREAMELARRAAEEERLRVAREAREAAERLRAKREAEASQGASETGAKDETDKQPA